MYPEVAYSFSSIYFGYIQSIMII